MRSKFFYAIVTCMAIGTIANGQTTVTGLLIDNKGNSLSDITVSVGSLKTKTGHDGKFSLYYPYKGQFELTFTGVGFKHDFVKISPSGHHIQVQPIVLHRSQSEIDQVDIDVYKSPNNKVINVGKGNISDKDLPQAVQIITNQVIRDQQINTLGDALKNANGIAIGSDRGAVNENFFARGYSLGTNNIFKNGARTNNGGRIEASTLESIELLKGSAALLYGGVSGGAVINMVTKKPKFQLGGEVSMRYGSWDTYKPTLDIYGPLSEKVAFRFIGTGSTGKSFRDYVSSDRIYVNPSVLYKISDKTNLNFNFDYQNSDFTPDFGIGTVDGKINESIGRNTFLNVHWAYNKTNSTNGQVALEHSFNSHWKLNANASFQNYIREYYSSERLNPKADGLAPMTLNRTSTEEFTTNEQINLTGDFKTGSVKHQLLVGLDADQSTINAYTFNIYADKNKPNTVSTAYGTINVFDPDIASLTFIPHVSKNTRTKSDVNRYGAFVQDLISVTSKLKVLAGIRYTYQHTPVSERYTYNSNKTEENGMKYNDKAWSPKFALIYQPIETMSTYVSYSNNFTSNSTSLDINNEPLGPSIIDQYEAGIKNDFFKGRFSVNLTWYKIINNNFAQNVVLADGTIDSQHKEFTGKTASDGVEVDFSGQIIKGLNVIAGYAYNFMRYTSTLPNAGTVEGVRLVGTTANTANATIFYTIQNGSLRNLKVGGSAFYTGKRNAGWNNTKINVADGVDRLIPVGAFTTVDFSLGYSIGKMSILAKIANIGNVFNYYVHENYSVNPIPPRNFITTLSYKF